MSVLFVCRYYQDEFKAKDVAEGGGRERMCTAYIEGLCWVLKYYYDVSTVVHVR